MEGVHRFLARVWRLGTERLAQPGVAPTPAQAAVMNRTVGRVTEDTEAMRFNTAIAAMMEAVNAAYKWDACPRPLFETLVLLLAPYAPHIAEELWQVGICVFAVGVPWGWVTRWLGAQDMRAVASGTWCGSGRSAVS